MGTNMRQFLYVGWVECRRYHNKMRLACFPREVHGRRLFPFQGKWTGFRNGHKAVAIATIYFFCHWAAFGQSGFYRPKSLCIPAFSKPKQVHISIGAGGGLEGTVGYSFSHTYFLCGSYLAHRWNAPRFDKHWDLIWLRRYEDVYRVVLGRSFSKPSFFFHRFETMLGAGRNQISFERKNISEKRVSEKTTADSWTVFAQANMLRITEFWDASFSLKLAYTGFNRLRYESTQGDNGTVLKFSRANMLSLDPAMGCGAGQRGVRVNLQIGCSIPLTPVRFSGTRSQVTNGIQTSEGATYNDLVFNFFGRLALQYNIQMRSKKEPAQKD